MTDTQTPPTTDVATLVDTYIDMWNEDDPARRAELIAAAWADSGAYTDPLLEATGATAISEMVDAVHAQLPGHRFRLTSGIDSHHDHHRFGWELAAADGTVAVEGIDVAQVGADGRFVRITGFFGALPALDA
jgi:hypothetical protein